MARPTTGIAYLIFMVTILGGFVFTVFATIPAWSQLEDERQRLQATIRERDDRQAFLAHIDARAEELKALEKEARMLQVMFPDSVQAADLAALLHSLSVRDGVVVQHIGEARVPTSTRQGVPQTPVEGGAPVETGQSGGAPGAPAPGKPYEVIVIVRGTYAQVRAFLLDLERTLQFFDVLAVDLQREKSASGEAVVAHITLRVFTIAGSKDLVTPTGASAGAG